MIKPLQGRRILVTRPAAQAGKLAQLIVEKGGEPLLFPLLQISPADDPEPLQQVIGRLEDYAMAVFISPNAVDYSVPLILFRRAWPPCLQAAAIGPSTVAQLVAAGVGSVVAPEHRFDSEALLELPELQALRVAGKKVLILRGNGGRELLAETLIERGAQVDAVTCYKRLVPTDGTLLMSLLRGNGLDALTISSTEGLRNLLHFDDQEVHEKLFSTPVFVPHQRIADAALNLGFRQVTLTGPADAGIIDGLCEHDWFCHEREY